MESPVLATWDIRSTKYALNDKLYLCLFLLIHRTSKVFHLALPSLLLERISQGSQHRYRQNPDRSRIRLSSSTKLSLRLLGTGCDTGHPVLRLCDLRSALATAGVARSKSCKGYGETVARRAK